MSEYGLSVFPQHAALLAESGVSADVARQRGYVSVDTKKRLADLGFGPQQRRIPGLLIPVHDETGKVVLHQYRPDEPRTAKAGKAVKYETPQGARMAVDVPPSVRDRLGDPNAPLWITEGVRKADAAASAGLACVALLGVWNWKGRNEQGGSTALAFWDSVALKDRHVYVAFDSDVMIKPPVHQALSRLGAFLDRRGASVRYVYLPPKSDGGKVGLDDFFATGGDVADLVLRARPEPVEPMLIEPKDDQPVETGIDGSALLDRLHTALTQYVIFPSVEAGHAVTLWIAATHAQKAWECATRLAIVSPEKRCGKSRLLDVIEATSHAALMTVNISSAALVRSIGNEPPTLLLDEADTIFSTKKADANEDLRGIINAGHARGRPYIRWDVMAREREECPTFAMAALAGIGDLPDTIMDRSVVVRMRRRSSSEHVLPYRRRRDHEPLRKLGRKIAAWAGGHVDALGKAEPGMPVEDRAADTWEPLVAIADIAGGDWPQLARTAALKLVAAESAADVEGSMGVRLLADIRDVFRSLSNVSFLSSRDLVSRLQQVEEAPWRDEELTMRKLALRLKAYGVSPRQNAAKTARGYHGEDFADAFARYLPSPSVQESETDPDQQEQADTSPDTSQQPICPDTSGEENCPEKCPDVNAGHNRYADAWTVADGRVPEQWPEDSSGAAANAAEWVWCAVCREPMTVIEPGQTAHPGCAA